MPDNVPLWRGQALLPGYWWLQFPQGASPRYWDGAFWKLGTSYVPHGEYRFYEILGPCRAPRQPPLQEHFPLDVEALAALASQSSGWTVGWDGELIGATEDGYRGSGVYLGVLMAHALDCSRGEMLGQTLGALIETNVNMALTTLRLASKP